MGRYLLQRLGALLSMLFIVSTLVFFLMHAVPGGPWDAMQMHERGKWIPPGVKEQLDKNFGLDKPVWQQYLVFIKNAVRLDFGYSFMYTTRPVSQILLDMFPYTLHLGGMTIIFSLIVGVGLGIAAALRQGTWVDKFGLSISLFCMVVPSFVFAVLLQYVISVKLRLLPTSGWEGPKYWIMPVFANSLATIGMIQRYTRNSILDVMRSNYVRTARAKGLSENRVMFAHIFKNALTPIITVVGPMVANLVTGSVFIESMFRIPGMGYYLSGSISNRDYPLIMASTMIFTFAIITALLVTDLSYAAIDPRVTLVKEK